MKTKTQSVIKDINKPEYKREPLEFMRVNNSLLSRAFIMGRYGMLNCATNFKTREGRSTCIDCNDLDDENHRINYCKKWQNVNLFKGDLKVCFDDIYSDNIEKCLMIVENILLVWDLSNGKNAIRDII